MTKARYSFAYHSATILLLALIASPLAAQSTGDIDSNLLRKCDPWLKHRLFLESMIPPGNVDALTAASESLNLFVSGDPTTMPELIRQFGGSLGSMAGSIATVRIPRWALEKLAALPQIWRLELAMPVESTQDSVRRHVHADDVHAGRPPLQNGVRGEGVIIGVVDSGIDFYHPEFLTDDGTTRLLSLVNLDLATGRRPEGLDRGTEWNREEINARLRGDSTAPNLTIDPSGHGTHVSGIAAGRSGIAPEADLIVVQTSLQLSTLTTDVLDAASYIYRRATAEGKPCVINASLGAMTHFHDGSDALSRGLTTLVGEAPGRILVAGAGNEGEARWHWGNIMAEKDSIWIYSHAGTTWIRVADSVLDRFELSVEVDSLGMFGARFGGKLGQAPWRTAGMIYEASGFSDRIGDATVTLTASSLGNGHTGIIIELAGPASACYRLLVRGEGRFNAWGHSFHYYPQTVGNLDDRYRYADSLMLVRAPGIAEEIITVGSCTNRSQYSRADGRAFPDPPATPGTISGFSSRGPRSDGLFKPDIVAPGEYVVAARSRGRSDYPSWQLLSDSFYRVNSGTSMATPVVSGAVALYLQLFPNATVDQVRAALYTGAVQDNFTSSAGPLPNSTWGVGKLDVFRLLTGATTLVPGQSATATTASALWIHPLPASSNVLLEHDGAIAASSTLLIYDRLGREIRRLEPADGATRLSLDVTGWPAGIYYCCLVSAGRVVTGRILVER